MDGRTALVRQNVVWLRHGPQPTVCLAVDDQRSDYAASLAGLIIRRRVDLGITSQAELGRRVGVSEATAGRWEAGTGAYLPDAWELRELMRILEVDCDELLRPEPLSPRERELFRRARHRIRAARDREAS